MLDDDAFATFGPSVPGETERAIRLWSQRDRSSQLVARWQPPPGFQVDLFGRRPMDLDPSLRFLVYGSGTAVRRVDLTGPDVGRDIEVGTHRAGVREVAFDPDGSRLASIDESGGLRMWPTAGGAALRALDASAPTVGSRLDFDASGARLGWASGAGALVWSLADPPDAAPLLLRGPGEMQFGAVAFDGEGRWAAAGRDSWEVYLWSLASPYPRVLQGNTQSVVDLAFTADSRFLATCGYDGALLWPISPEGGRQRLIDLGEEYFCHGISR